jgi:hypothetical protein
VGAGAAATADGGGGDPLREDESTGMALRCEEGVSDGVDNAKKL